MRVSVIGTPSTDVVKLFNGGFTHPSARWGRWGWGDVLFSGCHALCVSSFRVRGYLPVVGVVRQNTVAFGWSFTAPDDYPDNTFVFLTPIGPATLESGEGPGRRRAQREEALKGAFNVLQPHLFALEDWEWFGVPIEVKMYGYPSRAEAGEAARLVLERGFEAVRVRTWAGRRDPQGVVVQTGPATGAFMPASRGELEALGALARKALGRPPRVAILEDGRRGIALLSPYPLLLAASGAAPDF